MPAPIAVAATPEWPDDTRLTRACKGRSIRARSAIVRASSTAWSGLAQQPSGRFAMPITIVDLPQHWSDPGRFLDELVGRRRRGEIAPWTPEPIEIGSALLEASPDS